MGKDKGKKLPQLITTSLEGDKRFVTPSSGLKIRKEGIMDLSKMYGDVRSWFSKMKYIYNEKDNTTKSKDKGEEISIKFEAYREVDGYVKNFINISFLITHVSKVKYEGKNLEKCKMEILITAYALLDYKNKWKKSESSEKLHNFYKKYIIKRRIQSYYEGGIYMELMDLKNLIQDDIGLFS
ncbi:MAG: hypothetical protein PHE43_02400 [Candidatus Nanoarchaeia archaeon]|nr:hypothetical protein [Candidatus Nanoarchaeia archaeon]